MQIMQCFHTNIDRAKLVDSQSVFIFSLGGLDSSQFLLIEIDKISDVEHQLFCGDVELFDVEKKVWSLGPSLNTPRSALQGLKVSDFYG